MPNHRLSRPAYTPATGEHNPNIPAFANPVRSFYKNRAGGGLLACGQLRWSLSSKAVVLFATMNTSDTKCSLISGGFPRVANLETTVEVYLHPTAYTISCITSHTFWISDNFSSMYKGTDSSMRFNMISPLLCLYSLLQLHAAFSLPSVPLNSPSLSLVSNPVAFNLSKPT